MEKHKRENDLLIEGLWILEKSSGICIFEENYLDFTKGNVSSEMVGSFLATILTFAGEAFTGELQHIKFSNRKILFKFSENVLFIIAINDRNSDNSIEIDKIYDEIANKFNEKFQFVFKNGDWNGNTNIFNNFADDLKKIVKKEPIKVKFLQKYDFKEYLKKIEEIIAKKKASLIKHKKRLERYIEHKIKKRRH